MITSFRFLEEINNLKLDEKLKFIRLIALDLQNAILQPLFKPEDKLNYLDLKTRKSEERFSSSQYLDFIDSCLPEFMNYFEASLFNKLKDKNDPNAAEDLITYLKDSEANLHNQKAIERLLRVFTTTGGFIFEDRSLELFDDVSTILSTKRYSNPKLSADLLQAVCYKNSLPGDVFFLETGENLDYVLRNAKTYYASINNIELFQYLRKENSVLNCIYYGKADVLAVMLKYGDWLLCSESEVEEWHKRCFIDRYPRYALPRLYRFLRTAYNPKRLILILQLYYTFTLPTNYWDPHLKTIKLLWSSIPDAFIESREMERVLKNATLEEYYYEIKNVCNNYQALLCHGILKPRSLRHYARCCIRSVLGRNCKLPEGIHLLGLPDRYIRYLNLEI